MKKVTILFSTMAMIASMAWSQDYITLDVNNSETPATFEFTDNSECWDSTYSEGYPWLVLPPFKLSHLCGGASYGSVYWDGFTVCRSGDNAQYPEAQMLAHQWDVMPGGGITDVDDEGNVTVSGDQPYFLGYWSSWYGSACNRVTFSDNKRYKPVGMFVTNTCYAYYSVQGGTSSANAFTQEGDSFMLVAHGVNSERTKATTCEIELAGVHDGEFKGLTDWTWWDLSSLGDCDEIYFEMTSTDVGTWGINTPTYFAMDRLTVQLSDKQGGVDETSLDRGEVTSVTYVNLAGQQSQHPHEGMNIVITRYGNGSITTSKEMR